jgi:hypothetical protein
MPSPCPHAGNFKAVEKRPKKSGRLWRGAGMDLAGLECRNIKSLFLLVCGLCKTYKMHFEKQKQAMPQQADRIACKKRGF